MEIGFPWSWRQDVRVLSLSYIVWGEPHTLYEVGGVAHTLYEGGCLTLYERVEGCHTLYGVGGDAIHCMKGRRVPEVVNINPELRYEFGFIGGTISVSESRQFRKRSGRVYVMIENICMLEMQRKKPSVAWGQKVAKS